MITEPIGLYIHIPFCISKCNYCDFCSYPSLYKERADEYIDRLISEAESYRRGEKIDVNSIYFGGGTPSLLEPKQLGRILDAVRSVFNVSDDCEVTTEANPGTVTEEKLRAYRSLGVNRVSLGLQSVHENEMKILGRIHTYDDFLLAYSMLRGLGFDNISVDLMYGIPEQTLVSFRETLTRVIDLAPEHISAYGLIIEEGTPFFKMADRLAIPDEDEECDMYCMAASMLADAGYEHYEISNYSRPNRRSRHNLKYWRAEEYIGLGAAAYSYFEGKRYGNPRSFDRYMNGSEYENIDELDRDGEMFEYAMMRLRLADGIPLREYERRFGVSFLDGRREKLDRYTKAGLICQSNEAVSLTERGFYLSNTVMADIL